jgi:hypothetical protein
MEMPDLGGVFDWRSYPASAYALLAGNAIAVVFAVISGLDPAEVVWAYWLESVIIGFFTVLAFGTIALRSFRGSLPDASAPIGMATFFTFHYGMFHAVYFAFLYVLPWFNIADPDYLGIAGIAGILFLSHGYSFATNVLRNPAELENTKENRNRIMNAPYDRIIPMHMTIILSGFLMVPLTPILMIAEGVGADSMLGTAAWLMKFLVLLLFMSIKTIADLSGHLSRYQKS